MQGAFLLQEHFGLVSEKSQQLSRSHVSGYRDSTQAKKVMEGAKARKVDSNTHTEREKCRKMYGIKM